MLVIEHLPLSAQSQNLTRISGLPSSEAYDVLADRKGFIWVGHDLGLSRYDGHSFTNFTSPELLSLSMTDLNEDSEGRIWCHNFSGQIFYTEHEKLHVLRSYDPRLEQNFPRLTLIRNQLFATSDKGLFIYDIKKRKSKYVRCISSKGKPYPTSSLARLGDQIIGYGVDTGIAEWFRCDTNGRVKTLIRHGSLNIMDDNAYLLQPTTYRDTIYAISNIAGLVQKLKIEHDTVKIVGKIKMPSFINTLSQLNHSLWINTKMESVNPLSGQKIKNYDISDIINDSLGNVWYSSLKFGLLVDTKSPKWQAEPLQLNGGDYVRCISKINNYVLLGTQSGRLLLKEQIGSKTIHTLSLPSIYGAIEAIKPYDDDSFLIGASVGIFLYQIKTNKLKQLSSNLVLKDAVLTTDKLLYTAQSNNVFSFPVSNSTDLKLSLPGTGILPKRQRSRALTYDTISKTVYCAFKNDLIKVQGGRLTRILYNGNSIYVSSLVSRKQKVLAGTFAQGLLLIKPSGIKSYKIGNGLLSTSISKVALFNNHAWIAGNNCLQLFDMDQEKFIKKINFPAAAGTAIYAVWEEGSKLYIATANGLQYINYNGITSNISIKNYLLYSIINNHDTVFTNNATLPYHKNNISFNLGAVTYDGAEEVYFKYKLDGSGDNNKWQSLPSGVKTVQFASLMPGKYQFKAMAQHALGTLVGPPVTFNLIIQKPWWQQWWFLGLCIITVVLLTILIFKIYYKIILDKQKLRYEKILAIEYERQTISRELHDNIGQLLSLVKLTLGTTAGQPEQHKQKKIDESRELVGQAITDLRNISKNLSFHNISHVGLTQAIKKEAERIDRSGLLKMTVNVIGNPYSLGEQNELVLFRIFQEALNNTLKHADAEHLDVKLEFATEKLNLMIADDGKGFAKHEKLNDGGSGLKNMENRASLIGADIDINSAPGKGTQISLTLDTFTP
ncbi:sensor histidine kinase [Mucilaginibacter lacusdianchii]|uniref:sensor histidine kinase n=1 Tax=Mucilaginibacter lacusdianchii TaxID=2684211 RepID=UPI00131B0AFF|nr:histidine kinase [Mucilaginibacter sp. JXJ CY 39]